MANDFRIEHNGGQELIVVACPKGHASFLVKAGETLVKSHLVCPVMPCKATWSALIPMNLGEQLPVGA